MINSIELEYFRKHEHLSVKFENGLNIIRAANEGGKSSVTESIGYALFGTKALRTSLDDCVTWGNETKKLKVTLSINFDGKTYIFTRSKGGAEVTHGGKVIVTGQNEVSNFAAQMLGADLSLAAKLMFAGQNAIRSTLEEGPKALSLLIESLSGMEAFDTILEAAQTKLALGSSNLLEERLKGAESTLSAILMNAPLKPDVKAHTEMVKAKLEEKGRVEATVPDLDRYVEEIEAKHSAAAELYLKKRDLQQTLSAASTKLADAETVALKLRAVQKPTADIEALRKQVAEADDYANIAKAWATFNALPGGLRYQDNAVAFEVAVARWAGEKKAVTTEIDSLNRKMVELKNKRINHDTCDKCGQSILHLEHVVETNAQVDEMIAQLAPRLIELEAKLNECNSMESEFAAGRKLAAQLAAQAKALGNYVVWEDNVYPPYAVWQGGDVPAVAPVAPRFELGAAEVELKAWESSVAKLELAEEQMAKAKDAFVTASKAHDEFIAPDADEIVALASSVKEARLAANVARGQVEIIKRDVANAKIEFGNAMAIWEANKARIDDADKIIAQCKDDLSNLGFNNALVKKLRAIRPIVADKIWSTVLSSASVMFSQIRGEQSIITKGKDGFRCNGQAIESLSGSTLDALGLALRVALVRTFVPQCGLLVLDEVAAACDEERTVAMLSFIQMIDMGQTILITHESVSESVANNVIEL